MLTKEAYGLEVGLLPVRLQLALTASPKSLQRPIAGIKASPPAVAMEEVAEVSVERRGSRAPARPNAGQADTPLLLSLAKAEKPPESTAAFSTGTDQVETS